MPSISVKELLSVRVITGGNIIPANLFFVFVFCLIFVWPGACDQPTARRLVEWPFQVLWHDLLPVHLRKEIILSSFLQLRVLSFEAETTVEWFWAVFLGDGFHSLVVCRHRTAVAGSIISAQFLPGVPAQINRSDLAIRVLHLQDSQLFN